MHVVVCQLQKAKNMVLFSSKFSHQADDLHQSSFHLLVLARGASFANTYVATRTTLLNTRWDNCIVPWYQKSKPSS